MGRGPMEGVYSLVLSDCGTFDFSFHDARATLEDCFCGFFFLKLGKSKNKSEHSWIEKYKVCCALAKFLRGFSVRLTKCR